MFMEIEVVIYWWSWGIGDFPYKGTGMCTVQKQISSTGNQVVLSFKQFSVFDIISFYPGLSNIWSVVQNW